MPAAKITKEIMMALCDALTAGHYREGAALVERSLPYFETNAHRY